MKSKYTLILVVLLSVNSLVAQEWKTLKAYQKETGNIVLQEGCWLKKHRKRQSKTWKQANVFNLSKEKGNLKYTTISQIRDFYKWFDTERIQQGHEINGVGVASIAAKQLSNMDCGFIRFFIVRNKEIVQFANEGSQLVFKFAFPLLNKVYFSKEKLVGEKAKNWDRHNGYFEQCEVLEPLYKKLSKNALYRLEKMARGKGVFNLAVPKELKYVGEINHCETRFLHGKNKILPYYLKNRKQ
ncbi:hypothetical protein SAMN05444411_11366 [Lutibacter oricola]|uniref:Uncharacterized protein n=1 Tax=Lutibacter oricola TaxID=762486 RepID=A0A1H3G7M9_9FLAO|nr:hypothetical protein [Lutibacter oricola]SDX99050.1 hypothetical protein SAMN05444411_11366 [Lutibacter oricola]